MSRLSRMRGLFSLILAVLLALPAGDAASQAIPGPRKLLIDAADRAATAALARAGATLLADYGSFALWSAADSAARSLLGRSTVAARDDFDTIFLRHGPLDTRRDQPPLPAGLQQVQTTGPQFWMVQFVGPIKDEWLATLRGTGARLVSYMPNNAYVNWADSNALAQIERLVAAGRPLQRSGAYHPAYRLAPALLAQAERSKDETPIDVTVQLYTTDAVARSLATVRAQGGQVLKQPERILDFTNITLQMPAGALAGLARQADVFNVEPWGVPRKLDERQNQIIAGNIATVGGKVVPEGAGYLAWLTAAGLPSDPALYPIVDVVDDGIDNGTTAPLHPDFYQLGAPPNPSRIVGGANCTTDLLADGIGGHGNLNAGIVGGYNDQPDGAAYTDADGFHYGLGVAPYSRLAGTKIFRNSGPYSIVNCGSTDAGVVAASYAAGAAITSNSWGCGPSGGCRGSPYDASAQAYDALTRDATALVAGNQEMSHIFAAGNEGAGGQTLSTPGTAKNVITVGATENVREDGVTDGCGVSSSDNADDIVDFSSRGPTNDGRAKPDIMAPGSHIQGPASQAVGYNGSSVCDTYHPAGQTLYAWSSGTSHSTPAVAGAAALLYAYYRQHIGAGAAPSPAMLKAYLLNSTRYLAGAGANDILPSNAQGFGDVYLKTAFDDALKLFYDQQRIIGDSGEQELFFGQAIDADKPLAVTLAWTDAPGSTTADAYVNNLDLEVTIGGQTYFGNHFGTGGFSIGGGTADTRNNVEKVVIPAGVTGNFAVRVIARNIAGDGVPGNADVTDQDFALAIYNGSNGPVGTLQGTVEHASGTPIPGALVATDLGFSTLTDATGAYSLRLPADTYTVTASIAGYSAQTVENITIAENITTTQNFVLAGGAIQGRVFDEFTPAQPIAGALVGPGVYSATTDAGGNYFIPRVPTRSHTLTVTRAGYAGASATVVVADDAITTRDFTLPGGALAGEVIDASSGAPIPNARIGIPGNPPIVTGADGRYAARVPPGSYDLIFSKVGYAAASTSGITITSGVTTTYDAQLTPNLGLGTTSLSKTLGFGQAITDTAGLTLTNNASVPMTVTIVEQSGGFAPLAAGKDILLVNRNSAAANAAASAALTSLGYTFDAVDNITFEGSDLATLAGYRAVVYVGNTGLSATSASNTKLIEYLDSGGLLVIADNDLGYFNHGSLFYDTYLDATYGGDDPGASNRNLTGEDIMNGVNPPSVDPFPDYFTPGASSVAIFRYANSAIGGARIARDAYRAVYLASDFDRLGTTATGEPIEATVMRRSLDWLLGSDEIPWLEEDPPTVTIAAGASAPIDIGWHAERVAQPGAYTATLRLRNTLVPTLTTSIPATMIVSPTVSQGKLAGVVSSSGVCDAQPGVVAGARITIQGTGGFSVTLTTDAAGAYSYWLDAGSYDLAVSAAEQSSASTSVEITPGASTGQDFRLRLQAPCVAATPPSLSAELRPGEQVTRTLTITSAGALPLDYSILESSGAFAAAPDAAGYLWTEQPAQWIDTTGAAINNPVDDGEFQVTLPFTLPFYDLATTQLRVGNNGAALLGTTTGDVPYVNVAMNANTTPNYFLAPFWDDLTSQTGGVYYQSFGAAPNRKMVIEWRDRPHYNNVGAATFQMVLYEGGSILFQYRDVDFGSSGLDGGASATVGIRGPNAAHSSQFSFNTAALANGRAVCFVRPGAPACSDVPWLATAPSQGTGLTGDPPSAQQINVLFDAETIAQPGVYTATLAIAHTAPQPSVLIPVTMTVLAPSPPPGGVTLVQSGGSTAVTEGGAADSYTLVLDTPPAADVTISFEVGTQIEPIAALIFTPGNWNIPQTANVRAIDDSVVEGIHSATIVHHASSADTRYNGAALPIANVSVTIADNDSATSPTYTLHFPVVAYQLRVQ
jgi:hypothetical protein